MMLLCCVDVTTAWAAMRVTWALHELPGMAVSHRPWHALVEGVGHHARSAWLMDARSLWWSWLWHHSSRALHASGCEHVIGRFDAAAVVLAKATFAASNRSVPTWRAAWTQLEAALRIAGASEHSTMPIAGNVGCFDRQYRGMLTW